MVLVLAESSWMISRMQDILAKKPIVPQAQALKRRDELEEGLDGLQPKEGLQKTPGWIPADSDFCIAVWTSPRRLATICRDFSEMLFWCWGYTTIERVKTLLPWSFIRQIHMDMFFVTSQLWYVRVFRAFVSSSTILKGMNWTRHAVALVMALVVILVSSLRRWDCSWWGRLSSGLLGVIPVCLAKCGWCAVIFVSINHQKRYIQNLKKLMNRLRVFRKLLNMWTESHRRE